MMQLTIEDAIRTADRVISATAAKADREYEGWTTLAYAYLKAYIRKHPEFWSWELRDAMKAEGYAMPSELRAWGAVYKRAQREGLIRKGEQVKRDPHRHGTMTAGWVKA